MQIKKSNSKDDLTGLHTYRSFTEIIEEQIIKAEDIIAARPPGGIDPEYKHVFVGHKAAITIKKDTLLAFDMI